MSVNKPQIVDQKRVYARMPAPVFVDDLAAEWAGIRPESVAKALFMHAGPEHRRYVWARLIRYEGPDVCGPLALSAAKQVAAFLGSRVEWLSRLILQDVPADDRQNTEKRPYEPTFHAGKKSPGPCQGPAQTHL